MKHLALLPAVLLVGFSLANAQEDIAPAGQTDDYDLIAWSWMQSPEPIPPQQSPSTAPTPEPQPETQPQQNPSPTQPAEPGRTQTQSEPGAASASPSDTAGQTVTGTISKDGDSYVLKVSDSISYKLDAQDQAKQFEGQRVRVLGIVDLSTNLIHVQKIEPLS